MIKTSFLDLFNDIEIDLTSFFNDFGIEFSNDQGNIVTLKNLFELSKLDLNNISQNNTFFKYTIQNNDSPDVIARNYYGKSDYWWLVLLSNKVINPLTDWLLTDDQIYMIASHLSQNQNRLSFGGYYNLLIEQNEAKRQIILLKADYLFIFLKELKGTLNE